MFLNRVRLPFYFSRPQFPVERNIFRRADGSRKVLTASVSMTYEGKTDMIPKDWHQKLVIALSHDVVNIEGDALMTEVVMDSDYGIDWSDFLDYPVAQANFTVQVTPFNATNSNCQTCDEIAQLDLTDDTTAIVYSEGTTNDFPFNIFTNDSICCYPFVVSIASFNTTYFTAVSVSQAGLVTFTLKPSVPDIANVLLATYRVTCPNGAYDEANIYIGIEGTSVECVAPQNLEVITDNDDATISRAYWDAAIPVPSGGYDWYIYACDDIYTVLQSGNKADAGTIPDPLVLTGLTGGECYILAIQSDCGGDLSSLVTYEFTQNVIPSNICSRFLVSYFPEQGYPPQNISYFDCSGILQLHIFTFAGTIELCMLVDEGDPTTPYGFAASTPDINVTYLEPC